MQTEYKEQLQTLGWRLKLNDTLKGLVKFSAQLQSIRPFFSFQDCAECLNNALTVVEFYAKDLTDQGYLGTADKEGTGIEYVQGCVLFFGEWSTFFTEKMKISGLDTYFLIIPEGGSKPQFCIERIGPASANNLNFKFVKDGDRIIEYTYKENRLQSEKLYHSYEELAFSLFGH